MTSEYGNVYDQLESWYSRRNGQHLLENISPQETLNRLNYHWGIPDLKKALASCTRCRQCETACTQHLPILDRFDKLLARQEEVAARKRKVSKSQKKR